MAQIGGPGRSGRERGTAELAGLGESAGLDSAPFTACLSDGRYLDWPAYVTARAIAAGVEATPTVLVAGAPVRAEGPAIAAAVARASEAR